MKTTSKAVVAMLALGVSAWVIVAQDNNTGTGDGPRPNRRQNMNDQGGPGGPGGPGGQGGQGMRGRRPVPPLINALDANHDGVIDADEIANASAALKKLDKNGDGKLTQDELMPQGMGPGNGQGQGGPGRPPRGGGPDHEGPAGPPPGDQ
ncbi:MAG: hypothetical protein U1F65_05965 [Verrucomicrobiota bacterium]